MNKPPGYAVFASTLKRWDTPKLMQAADFVAELQSHPGYEVVRELIEERRDVEVGALVHGPLRDQAGYVEVTSRLSGLESSLVAVDAVRYAAQERDRAEREREEQDHGGA